jgi:hypothetical protein
MRTSASGAFLAFSCITFRVGLWEQATYYSSRARYLALLALANFLVTKPCIGTPGPQLSSTALAITSRSLATRIASSTTPKVLHLSLQSDDFIRARRTHRSEPPKSLHPALLGPTQVPAMLPRCSVCPTEKPEIVADGEDIHDHI